MKYISVLVISFLFTTFLLTSCAVKKVNSNSTPITHQLWDTLVKQYVTEKGNVNYKGFIADSVKLNQYLTLLENNHPNDERWSKDERLAYWINAYNAFTVKLIADNYPVESIKDIKNGIPFVNTVWDIKFIEIEGNVYDLNNLEHGIARKQFNDPRIHAAFNCASFSCPRLRNEAYTAERLDEQLDDQMRYFINNPDKNILDPDKPKLSKIFKWYRGDFKSIGMNVNKFINKYAEVKIKKKAKKSYLDYSWKLNEGESDEL